MKKGMTFLAGLVVGILSIYLWGQISDSRADTAVLDMHTVDSTNKTQKNDESADATKKGAVQSYGDIQVVDQVSGGTVQVANVNMPKLGWVVVHEIRDGIIYNALGASLRDAGEHSDIAVYLLRHIVPGAEYAVVLYEDDGDRQFSMASDAPIIDADGGFVMSKFKTN